MTGLRIAPLPQRAIVEIAGPDARDYLQGLLSNDVGRLDRTAIYAALLSPQGKFLFDMLLAEADGSLFLDCAADSKDDLLRRLTMYRLRARVTLTDRSGSLAVLALFPAEPAADPAAPPVPPEAKLLYRDPRLPALGWRAIVPADRLCLFGPHDADAAAFDRHRLALGVPAGAQDIEPGRGLLLESNFEELHGVDFHKGCFVGQELTARTKHRALVKKRLWGVLAATGQSLPPAGTPILLQGKDAGQMASSRDGRGLALLRLDKLRASLSDGDRLMAEDVTLEPVRPPYLAEDVLDAKGE